MRHLRLLLTLMSVCVVTLVSAAGFTIEGIKYSVTNASAHTVSLTGWDKSYFTDQSTPSNPTVGSYTDVVDGPVELVIPWRVLNNGIYYRVTSIGEEAFNNCNTLTKVTIPNSVESIEDYAFKRCVNLLTVTVQWITPLPIDANVFEGVDCASATLNVLSGYKSVYQETDVWQDFGTINTYYDVDVNMWFKDPHVKDICVLNWDTDGDGELTYREAQAVQDLGAAFIGDTEMTSFTELRSFSGITTIPASTFKGCSNLTEIIIASNVTSIGQEAFVGCTKLSSVTFQRALTSIGPSAFAGCTELSDLALPALLETIGEHAFDGCSQITSFTIPSKVSSIGNGAFANCSSNTSFTVNTNNAYFANNATKTYITRKPEKSVLVAFAVGAPNTNINLASTVYEILPYAFQGANNVASITLNKVVTIGHDAFSNCPNLYSVILSDTLASIGANAFSGVAKGVRVQVPLDTPLEISEGTFSNYEPVAEGGLTGRLFIPAGSKELYASAPGWSWFNFIEEGTMVDYAAKIIQFADEKTRDFCVNAFDADNDGYFTIDEAAAITSIGTIFQGSEIGSFNEFKFFTHLTNIEDNAFNGSTVTGITLPESIKSIGDHAFANCNNLTTFNVPASVETIGVGPFSDCASLKTINVATNNSNFTSSSGTLFNIDRSVLVQFPAKNSLTSIAIPVAVKTIAPEAFKGAASLKSVNLSTSSVSSIGELAFAGCTSFTSMKVAWATPLVVPENIFEDVDLSKATLNVPNGLQAVYEIAPVWKDFGKLSTYKLFVLFEDQAVEDICLAKWDTNGDGQLSYEEATAVTELDNTFQGNTQITSFGELAEFVNITSIPDNAFKGCTSLTKVTLPPNVTTIGEEAFEGCSSLTNVSLPTTVTTIGKKAFYGCEAFTTSIIPASVVEIGDGAFGSCTSLKSFSVNSKSTKFRAIGSILFSRDSTTVIQFPAGISRTNFEVASTVFKKIAPYAFSGSVNLKTVVFNSVETIGEYAFEKCQGITSLTIGDKVKTIGVGAFTDCQSLQAIIMPTNVTSVGQQAFNGMPAGVRCQVSWTTPPSIPANTFSNFETLGEGQVPGILFVPKGAKSAYQNATGWKFFTIVYEGSMSDYDATLITFADPNVKQLAVANWDTNGDNQLSYDEAAAVKSIGAVFSETPITTFNELKYFTSLTEVSNNAFKNTGLTAITMPEGITRIGNSAFQGTAISKWNTLPGLKEIGDSAFAYNTGFTALTISANIIKLGTGAFKGCPKLTSIGVQTNNPYYSAVNGILYNKDGTTIMQFPAAKTVNGDFVIGSEVTTIGEDAFLFAKNLKSVTIPVTVTSIKKNAFRGCTALDSVTVEWHTPLSVPATTFEGVKVADATLCVPKGTEDAYRTANVWRRFGKIAIYLDDVSTIDFEDELVKTICVANWDMDGDGELTVGEAKAVKTLGSFFKGKEITAFDELKYFTGITTIASSAFNGCTLLEKITLPKSTKEIAYAAFNGCSSLKSLVIPAAVTVINTNGVFPNCSSLMEFIVAEGNTRFSTIDGVLFDAAKTTLVAYPGGREGEYTVPASVTSIRQYAFCGATKLTLCHLPKNLNSIPNGAFDKCSSLTYVNIPASVKTVGQFAFFECPNLAVMKLGWEEPLGVDASVFQNTETDGVRLYVPAGSKFDYMVAPIWENFAEYIEYPNCDVNADGFADMLDAVDIIKYVVATPIDNFDPFLADFDDDEYVTVADAVILVGKIADGDAAPNLSYAPQRFTGTEELSLTMASNNVVSLGINSRVRYTAFQFDLVLPDYSEVEVAQLTARATRGHQLVYNKIGENTYRFAALSFTNAPFNESDGSIINIQTGAASADEIVARNIKFVTTDGVIHTFDNVDFAMPTGIVEMNVEESGSFENGAYYNLNGVKVERPGKGVYIVNGKKVIIK